MGSALSCVSCVDRDREEQSEKPINAQDLLESEEHAAKWRESTEPTPSNQDAEKDELQGKINAIVKSRRQQPSAQSSSQGDTQLEERINAIVKASVQRCNQSPVPCSPASELKAPSDSAQLQDHINAIVAAHAKSLKHQRVSCTEDPAWQPADHTPHSQGAYASGLASPSPAESFSDRDLEFYANLIMSGAKARNTPSKAPPPPLCVDWDSYETDVAPCQLNFGGADDDTPDTQKVDDCRPVVAEPDRALACIVEDDTDCGKAQQRPFDVTDIPSPTRNRAKRQQALLEAAAKTPLPVDSSAGITEFSTLERCNVDHAVPVAPPCENAIKEDPIVHRNLSRRLERAACIQSPQKFNPKSWAEEELDEVEQDRAEEDEVARKEEEEAKSEMAAMDRRCVETFLESVSYAAWRERVRTPIKGTNLYTKHVRPCRPCGTSVDVKDSSFLSLGNFLRFLEAEGLLRLKPGLTDPLVTEIRFSACSKYQYDTERQLFFMRALKSAPVAEVQWQ
jgi:hypothetical protein